MTLLSDYIEKTMRMTGYTLYSYETVSYEKAGDKAQLKIQAFNDYYFLHSYFFPHNTEVVKFSITSDNTYSEFIHQKNYNGLNNIVFTNFYTGLISLEILEKSRIYLSDKNAIPMTSLLINFIKVTPYL